MSPQKAMSVRLPEPMNAQIHALARVEGVHISELVREAIGGYLSRAARRQNLKGRVNQNGGGLEGPGTRREKGLTRVVEGKVAPA